MPRKPRKRQLNHKGIELTEESIGLSRLPYSPDGWRKGDAQVLGAPQISVSMCLCGDLFGMNDCAPLRDGDEEYRMMQERMLGDCERELTHTRRIDCRAYRRRDGLWEIEAVVEDEKAEAVHFRARPTVGAGEFMHRMTLAFLIDGDYAIRDVRARTIDAPWPACGETDDAYRRLIGLRIGPGFKRQVHDRVGGDRGCTHITDLLTQVGNTYMQASWPDRVARQSAVDPDPRRWPDRGAVAFVGQCHAWRRDGDAVQREYPELAPESDPG